MTPQPCSPPYKPFTRTGMLRMPGRLRHGRRCVHGVASPRCNRSAIVTIVSIEILYSLLRGHDDYLRLAWSGAFWVVGVVGPSGFPLILCAHKNLALAKEKRVRHAQLPCANAQEGGIVLGLVASGSLGACAHSLFCLFPPPPLPRRSILVAFVASGLFVRVRELPLRGEISYAAKCGYRITSLGLKDIWVDVCMYSRPVTFPHI